MVKSADQGREGKLALCNGGQRSRCVLAECLGKDGRRSTNQPNARPVTLFRQQPNTIGGFICRFLRRIGAILKTLGRR
jgi:hypothetical protein